MAQDFHLRLITQRAGGGAPIVRERRAPGPEVSIGRAADNDVVLADLAVDPKHARMRFAGTGRIRLESVAGLPFEVDGRSTQGADLDLSRRPVAAFGAYRLAFEPAEDSGAVVTVTREESEDQATPSIFSLQAPVFNRRRMAWGLGLGIFLICLLVPLVGATWLSHLKIHADQQWSSGALSRAHAFLENDCQACHARSFVAVRDATCLSCHQAGAGSEGAVLARARNGGSPFEPRLVAEHAPHDKLRQAAPLPGGFGPKVSALVQRAVGHSTDRCANCHVEHTRPQKTATADPRAPLADKPALVVVQDCQSCHSRLKMRLKKTDLIDTPDWSHHPAFRPLVMTAVGAAPKFQRVALSTAPPERNGLTFPHRLHLDPRGGVARQAIALGKAHGYGSALECVSCHRRDAGGAGFRPIEMERDCGACHSLAFTRVDGQLRALPHGSLRKAVDTLAGRTLQSTPGSNRVRPGTIRPTVFAAAGASAYRAAFSPGGTCYDCHTISWSGDTVQMAPVKLATRYLPRGGFDHRVPEHGGPGASKTGGFKCADCHKATTSDRSSDVLMPDLAKCASCHGRTNAQTQAAADADCATCHSFHAPGAATPKPGHPPLEALRWTQTAATGSDSETPLQ